MAKRKRYFNHNRNLAGVQFEALRRNLDAGYNNLHDSLEDSYYNYWKHGQSKSWNGYDVQPTAEESKELFDILHGLIWLHYTEELHAENRKLPAEKRYDENKYDIIRDKDNRPIGRRSAKATQAIKTIKTERGITIQKPKRERKE